MPAGVVGKAFRHRRQLRLTLSPERDGFIVDAPMAKQFDKISRYLLGFDTVSWARFLGFDTDQAELSNADFSTVTSQADAVMLLGQDRNRAAHVEIRSFSTLITR
jgi:hypothetical protein